MTEQTGTQVEILTPAALQPAPELHGDVAVMIIPSPGRLRGVAAFLTQTPASPKSGPQTQGPEAARDQTGPWSWEPFSTMKGKLGHKM